MTKQEMIKRYGEEAYRRHIQKVNAYSKKRYSKDPEFREKQKAAIMAYNKKRYNTDSDFRERVSARNNLCNKERYCCESLEEVENYGLAKADDFEGWDLHHRLEINEQGKVRFTMKQLKKFGLYYNRPASELIWLTRKEHRRLHAISRRKDI